MNDLLYKLLHLLQSEGRKTGMELAAKLGVSRSVVLKIIKKLRNYGVDITSNKKRGYQVNQDIILINKGKIEKTGIKVEVFESIGSTNDYLKTVDPTHGYEYYVCIAEHQSHGRGRLKRSWYSPFAQNVYLSIAYCMNGDISRLSGLSMVVSLSILAILQDLSLAQNFKIKWPNDVYFKDDKISGVIIETIGNSVGGYRVIIGIGINVNMVESVISNNWTSLKKITSKHFDRNKVCSLLIDNLIKYIKQFEMYGFGHFIEEWNKLDYLTAKVVSIENSGNTISGLYQGVNTIGQLLLQTDRNGLVAISSGDISL
ncbi:biotin--[acetyl-CoA-carboxylase] ligase [Candidatus Bandiella euplotis]|uniref:Bifunctional ligase/repressor BirA n=1 Tax=Candidatus Bandiella euplotis TaxID=1664265 RepID=A0ABZ0UK35_9RICK|nr:biotin--[acetyl-CoA-carboxylase] ligase [Candidatus Bandiella woodruffii]WPX96461.1 Bifunctional ligase/repressor BirA [Candidatus Bandiella woodruffii]